MSLPKPRSSGGLLAYMARHATAANLLLVILLVAGLAALPQMRAQFFPDVVSSEVSVSVTWEGAGAEDVDRAIVQVLEPALLAVDGVESTQSTSSEGSASLNLEFEPGYDMTIAAADVEAAVDAVTTLPDEAEEPTVRSGAWRDRVTDVVITGPVGPDQLGRFADEFVTRLFAEGVTRTTIRGVAAPRTVIEVPSVNLVAHDVSFLQIATAIAEEVNADPAGDVDGANARVRTGVEKRSASEIEAVVLRVNDDGSKLTVGDVARVIVEGADRNRTYFVGENPAVSIRVDRSAQGDAIAIQRQVEDVAEKMEGTLPSGTTIDLIRTRAEAISDRLNILLSNGLQGLALVVVLLFLFLNARTAFWVAMGIPTAMLSAIALMYLFGITLNMISLFALIITLGIVVDDAIVVGEHADARVKRGEQPLEAAENAAHRMALPVFSSTVTTVIAFFGLVAIGGRFGDLIGDLPITVIAVLLASLVECFLILPNHMAHSLRHSLRNDHWYDWPSRVVTRGFNWVRETLFRPFIAGVVWLRYPVLAGAVLLLASQAALFIDGHVKWRFFNAPERASITGNWAMVPGATRADTLEQMRQVQATVENVSREYEEEYGTNPILYVVAEVGGNSGRPLPGADTKDTDLLGGIAIELIDADDRPYSSFAFLGTLQERIPRHPQAEVLSFRGWRSGPGGEALDVQFYGASADVLKAASEDLKRQVSRYPEVSAVEDNLAYDKDEMVLELTPQGHALGFTIDGLGRVLRHRLNGLEAATYPDGPRSAEIRIQLPEGELAADFIERMQMRTPSGTYVPLSDLVTVETRAGFSTVRRENGLRTVSVTGDISEDDPARAEEIMDALEATILPDIASRYQVEWQLSGLAEQESEFLSDALLGFSLCLIGIYLTLAWVFSSWTRPIVVMAIIPFGLIGTVYGHYLWDVPLSMFSVVGILGMTGIIINDSIVLVTTIDDYAEDRSLFNAIIDGAADRLRPVFLTTATTVLGLAPLLYEQSQQAQFLRPTVITLVYGLGFGVVLVLMVVPALLAMQLDVRRQVTALRHGMRTRRARIVQGAVWIGLLAMLGWLAATLGALAWNGALWPGLALVLPAAVVSSTSVALALGLFLAGVLALAVGVFVVAALVYLVVRLRRGPEIPAQG
ncbi:efflux RND transporter permease subunit [Rhodalgimonas zhirmunskyi]|uniref:Efflux RND transporter permease subunit n=1 Tax=Rhodalgimonas zhirmunskyi TaxID=2964767 RepID=A0AAJ1U547_9RHOB|nr:efflux RND transporter permease subunit [Rhodoalgimonas zhirmunskyi]MDQ2093820.1 efflux RND transporter permease subunit [Rhodoalgimonas zhirmunskyi]